MNVDKWKILIFPHLVGSLACLYVATISTIASANQTVVIEYRNKPPYSYTENGAAKGLLIDLTKSVFAKAAIDATFLEVPTNRITYDIKSGDKLVCSPGWYLLPEREEYAWFSLPIYQDRPQLLLVGPSAFDRAKTHKSMVSLLKDESLNLGMLDGLSLGADLDKLIQNYGKNVYRHVGMPEQLAKMVALSRNADYMFIDADDYDFLNKNGSISDLGLIRLTIPDMPAGIKRHIICSKSIGSDLRERINKAISALVSLSIR